MTKTRPPAKMFLLAFLLWLIGLPPTMAQDEPPRFELFGGYSWMENDSGIPYPGPGRSESEGLIVSILQYRNLRDSHGWNGAVTYYLTRRLGVVAEIGGQYSPSAGGTSFQEPDLIWQGQAKSSTHSLLFGPRFAFRPDKRVRPFVHGLIGVSRLDDRASGQGRIGISYLDFTPGTEPGVKTEIFDLNLLENRLTANRPTVGFGGGVDLRLTRHLAVRLIQCDVLGTRGRGQSRTTYTLQGGDPVSVPTHRTDLFDQLNLRFSYGFVLTF